MTTTIMTETANVITTASEEVIGSIFGSETRAIPMFLPGGAINP